MLLTYVVHFFVKIKIVNLKNFPGIAHAYAFSFEDVMNLRYCPGRKFDVEVAPYSKPSFFFKIINFLQKANVTHN